MKIGQKVEIKLSNSKWLMQHPEVFAVAGTYKHRKEDLAEIAAHALAVMTGKPIKGRITDTSDGAVKVVSKLGGQWFFSWYEPKHVKALR